MEILVTGGAGYIGSVVVEALRRKGEGFSSLIISTMDTRKRLTQKLI